jgi:cytochrome P450
MNGAAAAGRAAGFVHPLSPAGRADPHPGYRWLRVNAPVYYDPASRFWLLSGHEACALVLRDARFSAALGQRQRARGEPLPASMLTTDAAEHDRLRAPGALLLGPAAVRWALTGVEAEIDRLVAGLAGRSIVDASADIGEPLATAVLGHLLQVPRPHWDVFADLARRASVNLDPMAGPAAAAGGQQAMGLLTRYLDAHLHTVAAGAGSPVAALAADARLTRPELLAVLSLVVVGGWRPLAELVGNALSLLLPRPDAVRRLRTGDLELARLGADEVLRLESPIPFVSRVATEPVRLPGGTLPAGARVLALLGAANRDPAVFAEPDELVLDRSPNPHLGLGGGGHYCLGAVLVRRVGAALLVNLLRAFPELTAVDPRPGWAASVLPRRLDGYRLELAPTRPAPASLPSGVPG